MTDTRSVDWYLYPRVCPILSVSKEDLTKAIELYGREVCFTSLATLITENYGFPYDRFCNPRTPAPATLGHPRSEGKPTAAPATMLLGGYRCTRLSSEIRIPGITLVMRDALSRLDWALDGFMEPHRMKCWVSVQCKRRQWTDTRNDLRSPYCRGTHADTLAKLLDAELINSAPGELLNHGVLRNILTASGEAIPPTVELYLQTINKLNPTSISAPVVGYGVSVAAMACVANSDLPCSYQLTGMSEEASRSIREFVEVADRPVIENTSSSTVADLILIDAIPYGTHDLRAYLGEKSTARHLSYPQHINGILNQMRSVLEDAKQSKMDHPSRIALVISLRELSSLPTLEPLLMAVLSDKELALHLDVVGALVSQKRDYAVYLMLLHSSPRQTAEDKRELWERRLRDLYPELVPMLNGEVAVVGEHSQPQRLSSTSSRLLTWDNICLNAVIGKLTTTTTSPGISVQGPRVLRGKLAFPSRTRSCRVVSETNDLETGDIVYVFGESTEPPLLPPATRTASASIPDVISDPLLSRMVTAIKENIGAKSSNDIS